MRCIVTWLLAAIGAERRGADLGRGRGRARVDPAAAGALRGLPVLFIHGDADDRVPLAAVLPAIRKLETAGATVTRRVFPGEDHFLLFSRLDEILVDLGRWVLSPVR